MYVGVQCRKCGNKMAIDIGIDYKIKKVPKNKFETEINAKVNKVQNLDRRGAFRDLKIEVYDYISCVTCSVERLISLLTSGFFGIIIDENLAYGLLEELKTEAGVAEQDGIMMLA